MVGDHTRKPDRRGSEGVTSLRQRPTPCRSNRGAATLSILLLSVMLGCEPSIIFYGDQALRAIIADPAEFQKAMVQMADEEGHRLALEWDPSAELSTAWLEDQLAEVGASVVVLSPYFSLFASELADTHGDVSFIGFSAGASERANLTRVVFNRVPAMEEAGSLVHRWEEAGSGRKAGVLFLTDSETRRAELEALVDSYDGAGSISVRRFNIAPDREMVRRTIRDFRAEGVNAFLLFAGTSSRFALELLQSEPVVFATDSASAATSLGDALLLSIENRLDSGVAAALRAIVGGAEGGTVTADAVVEIGGAYADPQLGRPVSDEAAADTEDES